MRLLCDENLLGARTLLAGLGELTFLPGRAIDAGAVAAADALLIRSQTRVDAALLADARPCFVGTATAGTEHVDRVLLERLGVPFAHAPGCNAEPVADWVVSVVADALLDGALATGARCAVVGCGAVGSRVVRRLAALGFEVLRHDPPAEARGLSLPGRAVDLATALTADLVTLHVPLVEGGPRPTRHLLDADRIDALAPGTVLLNAARGAVVDDAALAARLTGRGDLHVALDVYEDEPAPSSALLERCRVTTPHVAGHSLDGKVRGTAMIRDALCAVLERDPPVAIDAALPEPPAPVVVGGELRDAQRFVAGARDLAADTAAFRDAGDARADAFTALRRAYAPHRDFALRRVVADGEAAAFLRGCGFPVLQREQ